VLIRNADTNANHKPFGGWTLHGPLECGINNLQNRGPEDVMERCLERDSWSWYVRAICNNIYLWLTRTSGPAHAVYFGTYEVVKELAGGNAEDGKHHPGAAGLLLFQQ
jgi:hypothetical protein